MGTGAVEFDYHRGDPGAGAGGLRPVAKAWLQSHPTRWHSWVFYVDSGADYTLIPRLAGRMMGLSRDDLPTETIAGVGGAIEVRATTLPMRLGPYEFECKLGWAQSDAVPFLLGRQDVFDRFDVTFRQRERKILFEWRGHPPDAEH